ncbi:MAG: carboxypeptidase regulatory-like domain-containing protein [Caldilineae bacterium]|nr:MAG: carboxypeptidase regulatory-like domain-containing protein [Caldilineae bacterium]
MPEPINDAEAYGVRIVEADVAPGTTYWRVTRVHHLTPEENGGRHHIFLDALDEAGERVYRTRILITWDGGSELVVIDKPLNEPGANFPMWKWQICNAEVQGAPSDRVENLHTAHPDEAPGNTLFHHSFAITFQRTVAEVAGPADSVITGRVPAGAGHTLVLLRGAQQVATTQVAADEQYRFEGLPAGEYTVRDEMDGRQAGPVTLDGENSVQLDLPAPPATKALDHYYLLPPPDRPQALLYLSLLADHLARTQAAFGFALEEAREAARVSLVGKHPPDTRSQLEAAGCQVELLPTDPSALLAALQP